MVGKLSALDQQADFKNFLAGYQGIEHNQYFSGITTAYIFFLITFFANISVVYFGISKGIETLNKIALPILFICGVLLFVRVVTLGASNLQHPQWNISSGFGFLWNPDFSKLLKAKVWIEAAGQIFFTLSVGIGVILTYASYLNFLEDEFKFTRKKAVGLLAGIAFVFCQPAIFFLKHGIVDEMDFWGGSFCLIVFAIIETILFAWVLGTDQSWDLLHQGSMIKVPRIYKFIIKYVTPTYLLVILGVWFWQDWRPIFMLKNVVQADKIYVLSARIGIIVLLFLMLGLIRVAWRHRQKESAIL